jgi:hypothetical protein
MFDAKVIMSGAPIPAVDPEQFKRAFEILRSSAAGGHKATGADVFAVNGIPIVTHPEIFFRCSHLLLALDRGEFTEFVQGGEIDSKLLDLFATFPFTAMNIKADGTFQLNNYEFEKALEQIRK